MADITSIKTYYADRLIMQYRDKSKARETIKVLTEALIGGGLAIDLLTAFDLETATGDQLDIIGRIVGVDRTVYGLDIGRDYMAWTDYAASTPGLGFGSYSSSPYPDTYWKRYRSDAVYSMTDFEYRAVIKLKIIYNNVYATLGNVKNALANYFNGSIDINETANVMEIEINVLQPYHNSVIVADYLKIFPKGMGVNSDINYL